MAEVVAILGASDKPERYSNKAFHMLKEYGHTPIPVTPKFKQLEGVKAYAKLSDIDRAVDTLTMYVGKDISDKMKDEILHLRPKRVIFNPGSENEELKHLLEKTGVTVIEACTLVMLKTHQYDQP